MKTTEQKNRLIAEFMGVNKNNNGTYEIPQFGRLNLGGEFKTEFNDTQLKYHTSWDWLMPVVEKIEDIRIQPDEDEIVSYHRFAVDMPCGLCEITDTETGKVVASGDFATKILSTYEAVVEFIEWYNENK